MDTKPRILYAGPPWRANGTLTALEPAMVPMWVEAVTLAPFGDRVMLLTVTPHHPYISLTVTRMNPENVRVPVVKPSEWFKVDSGDWRRGYMVVALDLPVGWEAIPTSNGVVMARGLSMPDQVVVPSIEVLS